MALRHSRGQFAQLWCAKGFVLASICFSLTGLYYQSLLFNKRTVLHDELQLQHLNNTTTSTTLAKQSTEASHQHDIQRTPNATTTSPVQAFQAKYAPIFPLETASLEKPVRIRVLLFENAVRKIEFRKDTDQAMRMISDEVMNICLDGWNRSPFFEVVAVTIVPDIFSSPAPSEQTFLQEDQDIVWIVDMRRIVFRSTHSIFDQVFQLATATRHYQQQQLQQQQPHQKLADLKVVFMDFRDRFRSRSVCPKSTVELVQLLGIGNVRNVVQQVVDNRSWNPQKSFVNPGNVWLEGKKNQTTGCLGGFPTLQIPYTVRSDYVEAIDAVYREYLPLKRRNDERPDEVFPPHTDRPIDVAHFWALTSAPQIAKANLRNAVTSLILSLTNTSHPGRLNASHASALPDASSSTTIKVIGHQVSGGGSVGRTLVSHDYLQALLSTKIVVVAQRDEWEDHYRFFEAIVSGALVMTDPMWTLPEGYVHGENILVYNSLDHLKEMILYYLDVKQEKERMAIAERGWKLALTRHRTYHWMEELFFGRPLST